MVFWQETGCQIFDGGINKHLHDWKYCGPAQLRSVGNTDRSSLFVYGNIDSGAAVLRSIRPRVGKFHWGWGTLLIEVQPLLENEGQKRTRRQGAIEQSGSVLPNSIRQDGSDGFTVLPEQVHDPLYNRVPFDARGRLKYPRYLFGESPEKISVADAGAIEGQSYRLHRHHALLAIFARSFEQVRFVALSFVEIFSSGGKS